MRALQRLIPGRRELRRPRMLLLAAVIAIAMIVLVATMVFLVPAGTERVRRRGDGDVDSQGAELTPEDRSS